MPSNVPDAGFIPVSTVADDDGISGNGPKPISKSYLDSDDEELEDSHSEPQSKFSTATGATNDAVAFVEVVLGKLGIPSYGQAKYTATLKDNFLSRVDQLSALDSGDWKRLGWPLVIEEAVRKAVVERHIQQNADKKASQLNRASLNGSLNLKPAPRTSDSNRIGSGSVAVTINDLSDNDDNFQSNSAQSKSSLKSSLTSPSSQSDKDNPTKNNEKGKSNKTHKKPLVAATNAVESDDELDMDQGWDDF
jgi:hypothetical protein